MRYFANIGRFRNPAQRFTADTAGQFALITALLSAFAVAGLAFLQDVLNIRNIERQIQQETDTTALYARDHYLRTGKPIGLGELRRHVQRNSTLDGLDVRVAGFLDNGQQFRVDTRLVYEPYVYHVLDRQCCVFKRSATARLVRNVPQKP